MKKKKTPNSRRIFLRNSAMAGAGLSLQGSGLFAAPAIISNPKNTSALINGVQIGVITYSFRSMEDQSAEATLQYVLDSGINAIELMGDPAESFAGRPENPVNRRTMFGLMRAQRQGTLSPDQEKELQQLREQSEAYNRELAQWRLKTPMDAFEKFRKMYNQAGVQIYAFKPRAFGKNNSEAEMHWGMRVAKTLGASHVTLEHPDDITHTQKLSSIASQYGIHVAYHGHEQQTPTFWDQALAQSSSNRMNPDLGHYVAAGNAAPLQLLKEKHTYISSMHLKDRQTPDHGKGNLPWGKGDTPIVQALRLIRDQQYKFPVTIELEYQIPEGSNAVQEVRKCLEYCEKSLS